MTLVKTIANNNDRMSIRKALAYSGCSKNTYYYNNNKEKYHGNHLSLKFSFCCCCSVSNFIDAAGLSSTILYS